VGNPLSLGGLVEDYRSPVYATAVGLVLEGNEREMRTMPEKGGEAGPQGKPGFRKLGDWLKKEFF
jgi:cell division protein FtsA